MPVQTAFRWTYGFVIFDSAAAKQEDKKNAKGDIPLVSALRTIEAQKKDAKDAISDRTGRLGGWGKRAAAEEEKDDEDDGDDGGFSSGWFPEAFTRNPTPLELAEMQASMLGAVGAESEVIDILAPPENWDSKDNPDPLNAKLVDIRKDSEEHKEVVDFFKKSLGGSTGKLRQIHSLKRIESLSLWQSYKAKFRQLQMRAVAEGKDENYASGYEEKWMFHGTA